MTGFNLCKWYLDVVDPSGRSVVLYWSALEWGPLRLCWHAATLHAPGAAPRHVSSLAAVPEPVARDGTTSWRSEAIECEALATATMPGFEAELLPDRLRAERFGEPRRRAHDAGSGPGSEAGVSWRCEAPATRTIVRLGDEPAVEGTGYAERLELRLPPWRLPIDELRWGRWISDEGHRSMVWIDWQGAEPQTLVYSDAVRARQAGVGDGEVTSDGRRLTFADRRVLHERTLGDLLGNLAGLLPAMPRRWLALEDRKWLSRGVLAGAAGTPAEGWAIHERIVFP